MFGKAGCDGKLAARETGRPRERRRAAPRSSVSQRSDYGPYRKFAVYSDRERCDESSGVDVFMGVESALTKGASLWNPSRKSSPGESLACGQIQISRKPDIGAAQCELELRAKGQCGGVFSMKSRRLNSILAMSRPSICCLFRGSLA